MQSILFYFTIKNNNRKLTNIEYKRTWVINKGVSQINKEKIEAFKVSSNIIINSLMKDEKILIVLDSNEEYEMISSFLGESLSKLLHYYNKNTIINDINDKTKELYEKNIDVDINIDVNINKIKLLSKEIGKKFNILSALEDSFTKERECGINLLEMYAYTEKSISKYDFRHTYYEKYTLNPLLDNINYHDLCNIVKDLNASDLIKKYLFYRRFLNNNLIKRINPNILEQDIEDSIKQLDEFIDNPKEISLSNYELVYLKDLVAIYLVNYEINEGALKTLTDVISIKNISEKVNIGTGLNIINRIKKFLRNIKAKKNKETIINNDDSDNVYNKLLQEAAIVTTFIEKFEFLKPMLPLDQYNNIIKSLLLEENMYSYFELLKKTLVNFSEYKKLKMYFDNISNGYMEVLTYCYDSIDDKREMSKFVDVLPQLFLLYSIEKIEKNEAEILDYYNSYELLCSELSNCMAISKDIICKALKIKYKDFLCSMKENLNMPTKTFPIFLISSSELEGLSSNERDCFDRIIIYREQNYEINKSQEITENINMIDYKLLNIFIREELILHISKLDCIILENVMIKNETFPIVIRSNQDVSKVIAVNFDYISYMNKNGKYISEENNQYEFDDISIVTIWTKDWWKNRKKEIDKIKRLLVEKK